MEQFDEVNTGIAKSSLLHKENTDLSTIIPIFPGEVRQEIQVQLKENMEKINSVPESSLVAAKNTTKKEVAPAVDVHDNPACEDLDPLPTEMPTLKETIPELLETNLYPTAGITKFMSNQVEPASKEIKTAPEAEAILAKTEVVIFDPGAAEPTIQRTLSKTAKLRKNYTSAHAHAKEVVAKPGQKEDMLMFRPKHLQNQFEDAAAGQDGSTSDKGALVI